MSRVGRVLATIEDATATRLEGLALSLHEPHPYSDPQQPVCLTCGCVPWPCDVVVRILEARDTRRNR